MKATLPQNWRTQNRALRRVYAKYMTWLERLGYLVVVLVIAGFVYAFNYSVDETVSADKVKLELPSQPISFDQPVVVFSVLVEDKAEVKKGQPLLTYGPSGADLGRPLVYLAPTDGIFRYDSNKVNVALAAGDEFGKVFDPSSIVFKASLSGVSVSPASEQDKVKVTNIVVEPTAGVTYRQATPAGTVVSSQVFDNSLLKAATDAMKGYDLKLRDDRPFAATDVTDMTIESTGEKSLAGPAADPQTDLICEAQVTSGEGKAVVQVADLPQPLAEKLRAAVKDAMAKQGLQAPDDLRFVLKLKASPQGDSRPSITGTALTRTYDIQAKLVDPPPALLLAVRRALLAGKNVTAKVELKTGSRPLATILLKKS